MSSYGELTSLFHEFREFTVPEKRDGIHDYSPESMARQYEGLQQFKQRWRDLDTSEWSIEDRVDTFLVLGEMNVLEFLHVALRPWFRDPAFYCSTPTWEENMADSVPVPGTFPLDEEALRTFSEGISVIPKALEQAKVYLTEVPRDLADIGITRSEHQEKDWTKALAECEQHHPEVAPTVASLLDAVTDFKNWLIENLDSFTAPAGVGKDHYSWALKNIHFLPYDHDQASALVKRELARSKVSLKLTEAGNRDLPSHREPPRDLAEFQQRFVKAQDALVAFAEKHNLFPGTNYIVKKDPPGGLLRGKSFFNDILDIDHLPLYAHDLFGHSPDDGYRSNHEKELRRTNIKWLDFFRAEGMATGIEEILMQMGMIDDNPRARELGYILVAFRAARAMSELKMVSNELTFKEAIAYTVKHTPRGYSKDDGLAWTELQCYLRFSGYGLGYLIGKLQLDQLIADYADMKGEAFDIGEFFGNFLNRSMLPIALLRWEMTGLDDEMKELGLL
ncbi:MAG: DUF885 family protein [Verrucomicrobia bacterium]|jgi:hypothetical protein|nr:DUF885 family protein [Verrucomicrobiota bacterium]MBT7068251.1 DUF885 family protein [Verrucomicrobiota bacterium]